MDIHRIRFIKHPAVEINSLAFSHRSNTNEPTPPQLRLALGRANGDVEIWNPLNRGTSSNIASTSAAKSSSASGGGSCTWSQETILRSGKDRTIDSLAWTQDLEGETADGRKVPGKLRLFSIGYSTHVTEWDLAAGKPLRHVGVGQSEVWCMAAQPRWDGGEKRKGSQPSDAPTDVRQEQLLALGCGDGSIILLSTADGDLIYVKTLQRSSGKKPRVMSLAWYGRDRIVAGYSDSMIRVYEIAGRGKILSNMSLGNAGKGGPRETLVWTVSVLRDETIVSGDSTGEIKIWDARNYTLLQRLQSHSNDPADLLSLAASNDGTLLLSGDLKRRTTLYQRSAPHTKGGKGRWAAVSRQRHHQGDVKTMVAFESRQMSVVVSGGVDATPIVNPLRTFGQEHHRALPAYSSYPATCSAPTARLVMSWWDREARIWNIVPREAAAEEDEETEDPGASSRKLVAHLAVQGEESITSADINATGSLVAIASMSALKLFHIRPRKSASTYRISKVEMPSALASTGAKLIQFSPDGKWLAAALADNTVRLCRFTNSEDAKQPWEVFDTVVDFERKHGSASQRAVWGTHEKYDHVITRFAWSSDSRILVAGDLSGNLDTWVLEGTENLDWTDAHTANGNPKASHDDDDSSADESDDESHPEVIFGQHWKPHSESLPRLPTAPVVLSFRPSTTTKIEPDANIGLHATRHNPAPHSHELSHGEDRLVAVTARSEILEFNVMSGKLTDWSKRNPNSVFPASFRNVLDQPMGCIWDVDEAENKSRIWLYGSSWLWMFDLARDLPQGIAPLDADASDENKRKRKRELDAVESRVLVKTNAGAGGKVKDKELGAGMGLKVRTHRGEQHNGDAKEAVFEAGRSGREASDDESTGPEDADEDNNVDTDDEDNQRLVALRRKSSDGEDHDRDEAGQLVQLGPPHHWHTFKYRPIVAVVPLERGDGAAASEGQLEVALVECPLEHAASKER